MSAGVFAYGPCFLCPRWFTFNPETVPSYDPSSADPSEPSGRRPICSDCIEKVNGLRVAEGREPWYVFPDSYGLQENF